jgi:hypothetical protein
LLIVSVLVLGEVPELVSRFIITWQVVHPEEGLLFGIVSSLVMKLLSSVFPGIQGDRKVTAERMA